MAGARIIFFLLCQRYIKLNPVRAGMVSDPRRISLVELSCQCLGQPNAILSPHPLYRALSPDDTTRCDLNRDLFRSALNEEPLADLRMALNQDQPVGNYRFYAPIEAMTGQRRELRKHGRPRKPNETDPIQDTEQQKLPL